MTQTPKNVAIIARNTLRQALRSRLLFVSTLFAVVLVGISIAAASVSFGEQSRLILDVGLTAASGIGGLIAIALTVTSLANEVENKTAYPVLARPIHRGTFILGKYAGLVAAMELVVLYKLSATALTVWLYGGSLPLAFWASSWLTCIEMGVVISIALVFSTMTTPVLAAAYSAAFWLTGNLASDIAALAKRLEESRPALAYFLRWLYYVPPDLERFSCRAQAANDLPVPFDSVVVSSAYGSAYAAVLLLTAMWIFSARKVI